LQAFTPVHWIFASDPATAVLAKPALRRMAAAVASAAPEVFINRMGAISIG
jgi:hypothetical protein